MPTVPEISNIACQKDHVLDHTWEMQDRDLTNDAS